MEAQALTATGPPKRGEATRVNGASSILFSLFVPRTLLGTPVLIRSWLYLSLRLLLHERTTPIDRISIPSPSFAAALYTALQPHIAHIPSFQTHLSPPAKPCGLNSNIRLYRYGSGQYFGPHYDDSVAYTEQDAAGKSKAVWSEWTLLVYLTGEEDGVEGGEVRC